MQNYNKNWFQIWVVFSLNEVPFDNNYLAVKYNLPKFNMHIK